MIRRVATVTLLLAGCSAHQSPPSQVARTGSPPQPPSVEPAPRAPPNAPDVSHEVMGWLIVSDGTRLIRTLATVMGSGQPAANDPAADITAKVMLAKALGLDAHLAEALDLKRPAGVAVLNPTTLDGSGGLPVLALLPVAGRPAVEQAFADGSAQVTKMPWGLGVATSRGQAWLGFQPGYALVAWRENLVSAAARVLGGPLATRVEAPLWAHLDVNNLYGAYGAQLEATLSRFAQAIEERDDPQLSFAMRGARRLAKFADSLQGIDLLVDSDGAGLSVTARAEGKPGGAWAKYVGAQKVSNRWGANLVPRDAVLVYVTHRSTGTSGDEVEASVDYLGDASAPPAAAELRSAWREVLGRAAAEMAGEVVYSVWPAGQGGVGLGGAYRVRSAQTARAAALAAYRRIGSHLGGAVARALSLDPARFKLSVAVRQRPVAGTQVDTIEVGVRWPSQAAAERKLFERLFGPSLVMGLGFVGDTALFAVGRDWKERLGAMHGAASGKAMPTLLEDERFGRALAERSEGRVSLTYLPMGAMAGFIGTLVRDGHSLDAAQLEALDPLLKAAGGGAIVSATHAVGARYEVSTRVPASALPGLTKIGAVMWRIALSPLINPPAMPPLPIPPAHVTPKFPGARPKSAHSPSKTL